MEYFDVFDKDRNFLNKLLPRGTKLNPNEFNQGSEIWIVTDDNKILITQRSKSKSHPLMWEAPRGCSLAGENTLDTVVREIQEEIGLKIDSKKLKFLSTQLYKYQFVDIYTIKLNIDLKELKLQSSEIAKVKLVNFETFEKMIKNNEVVPYIVEHFNIIKDRLLNN